MNKIDKKYSQMAERDRLRNLKLRINENPGLIRSGYLVSILAFMSFLASLGLSLAGGYVVIDHIFAFISFVLVMIVCQFTIFMIAQYETIIKMKFNRHYVPLKLIQYMLLMVSISMNIMFFHENFKSWVIDIVMCPLCISLDILTLKLSNLGYDLRKLNLTLGEGKKSLGKSLLGLYKEIRYKRLIQNTLGKENAGISLEKSQEDNPKLINFTPRLPRDPQGYPTLSQGSQGDVGNLGQEIERYIELKYEINDLIDTKDIREKFELSDSQWRKVKTDIGNIGTTPNRRTIRI